MNAIRTWGRGPLAACLYLLILAACGQAADPDPSKPRLIPIEVPPVDPQIGLRPSNATIFDGRLWLVGGNGSAVSFGLNDESRKVEFADGVIAMTKSGGALWLLRKDTDAGQPSNAAPGDSFIVSRLAAGSRQDSVPLRTPEPPQALAIDNSTPVVIATQRLYALPPGARSWETRAPRGMRIFEMDWVSAAALNGDVYVASHRGEFGGGFWKVTVATGATKDLARGTGGPPCRGCESIVDLLPDPTSPGCLLASVAYMHGFAADGRILRICGDRISTMFEQPLQIDWAGKPEPATQPFFKLAAASPTGFWAVAPGTLYWFDGAEPKRTSIPDPKRIFRFFMNRDVPGLILIYSDGEPARNAAPIIVPVD